MNSHDILHFCSIHCFANSNLPMPYFILFTIAVVVVDDVLTLLRRGRDGKGEKDKAYTTFKYSICKIFDTVSHRVRAHLNIFSPFEHFTIKRNRFSFSFNISLLRSFDCSSLFLGFGLSWFCSCPEHVRLLSLNFKFKHLFEIQRGLGWLIRHSHDSNDTFFSL